MTIRTFTVIALLAALTSACESTTSSTPAEKRPTVVLASGDRGPGRTLVGIPEVGVVRWRCDGQRFGTAFVASGSAATAEASVQVDGATSSRKTVQPGKSAVAPYGRASRNVWTITQATEPRTLVVTVSASRPSACQYMLPDTCVTVVSVGHEDAGWERKVRRPSRCARG